MPIMRETNHTGRIPNQSRVAELLGWVDSPEELLPELAREARSSVGCDAAAILVLGGGQAAVLEGAGLSESFASWRGEALGVDETLARRLLWAGKGVYRDIHLLPITFRDSELGALAVMSKREKTLDSSTQRYLECLAELAAVSMRLAHAERAVGRAQRDLLIARSALERSEPMRVLGEMTLGLSHDLRNVLHPISVHLQCLDATVPVTEPETRRSVAEMRRAMRRGIGLMNRLRGFGRRTQASTFERVEDPSTLVAEAIEIATPRTFSSATSGTIAIDARLAPLPPVCTDPHELVAAIVNLLFNAIEAMPSGGTIRVDMGRSAGGMVIRVADEGPGIPKHLQSKVFDSFFTQNKETGTGLGLSSVKRFAKSSGGHVTLRSVPGAGAAFTIWLPAADQSA